MKTLKNNLNSIRENKDNYLPPSCKVYDLEMEGMVCNTSPSNSEMEEITSGGSFPGTSFWNSNN